MSEHALEPSEVDDTTFKPNPNKPYYTPEEAADYLGTTIIALRKSRQSGTLLGREAPSFIQVSERKVMYELTDLEYWIRQCPKMKFRGGES